MPQDACTFPVWTCVYSVSMDFEMQQDELSEVKEVCENNDYSIKQLYGTVENNGSLFRKTVQEIHDLES